MLPYRPSGSFTSEVHGRSDNGAKIACFTQAASQCCDAILTLKSRRRWMRFSAPNWRRVIDFGRFSAAPYCAMLLADFGADVIHVERSEGGEDRYIGPITESGEGGLYLNLNRNKRGSREVPKHLRRG